VALDVVDRLEVEGAFADLVLPRTLARRFVTELVYGTTRMRRCGR
jgi:hypothetical protein